MLRPEVLEGLHNFVVDRVLTRRVGSIGRAVDLGAGTGALAVRLRAMGWNVLAVDASRREFEADVPFVELDLDRPDFAARLGGDLFELVTAVEVIEHLENPVGFLRNVGRLIGTTGLALLTTPNVDNAPTRIKFLLTGRIRSMEPIGDPTHLTPIFWDLFQRQYLRRAGLEVVEHLHYPEAGFLVTRRRYAWAVRAFAALFGGDCSNGDSHIWLLQCARGRA